MAQLKDNQVMTKTYQIELLTCGWMKSQNAKGLSLSKKMYVLQMPGTHGNQERVISPCLETSLRATL